MPKYLLYKLQFPVTGNWESNCSTSKEITTDTISVWMYDMALGLGGTNKTCNFNREDCKQLEPQTACTEAKRVSTKLVYPLTSSRK